jgi:hypothetical protein
VTNQSTAPLTVSDDFAALFYRERRIAQAELLGFSPAQIERLLFLIWLDTTRDLEQNVRQEG